MERRTLLWRAREREIECGARTLVMGILNVTPDSFSDGGSFPDADAAIERGVHMIGDGADILDVGGESTRPGSEEVPIEEELARVLPVVEGLVGHAPDVPVSIDTRRGKVARAALDAGASIVNDVTAGADPEMFGIAADAKAGMVLMHMQGEPKTMQVDPHYDDVVAEVASFLWGRVEAAVEAGLSRSALCVDPGIGFGKTVEHNLALLRHVETLRGLDVPVLVGPSRKRFIGALLNTEVDERVEGTAGVVAWLAANGADIVRVHDVKEMARVARVVDAIARMP